MSRVISSVGIALCAFGIWHGYLTYDFLERAELKNARVTGVQELRGPPKPRQKTAVHIRYSAQVPDQSETKDLSAITQLPLLQEIKEGDQIRVLVDPRQPSVARLPLWSELWARPLTYFVGGILILVVGRVLRVKRLR
jgi:hypothetical protein